MNMNPNEIEKVAILDAGAQYGKIIDRRVRALSVFSDILPFDTPVSTLLENGYRGVIICGCPSSVYDEKSPTYDSELFAFHIPVLGICYGMQLINKALGGTIQKKDERQDAQQDIEVEPECPLFNRLSRNQSVLLTHDYTVERIGDNLKASGWSTNRFITAIYNEVLQIYGVQFHPEFDLTTNGMQMFSNFLYEICELKPNYTIESRKAVSMKMIRDTVEHEKILVLVSGGVHSMVCAALLRSTLHPSQIVAVHIDHGFMRHNESDKIKRALKSIGLNLVVIDKVVEFQSATTRIQPPGKTYATESGMLANTADSEEKRQIFNDTFAKVIKDIILTDLKLKPEDLYLAQPTLRTDLMKPLSQLYETDVLKEIRNGGRVVQPLSDFHINEVKHIGQELGLPDEVIENQPFPINGLAVRLICAKQAFMEKDFYETQAVSGVIVDFKSKVETSHALTNRITLTTTMEEQDELMRITGNAKMRASLLPVRTAGMKDNTRTYGYALGLSCETDPNWNDLFFLAKLIPRILPNVHRICFIFGDLVQYQVTDITPTTLTKYPLRQLRMADDVANDIILGTRLYNKISKSSVTLIPVNFDRDPAELTQSCTRSIVFRASIAGDFTCASPPVPGSEELDLQIFTYLINKLSGIDGISRVLYDITPKPPCTSEWE